LRLLLLRRALLAAVAIAAIAAALAAALALTLVRATRIGAGRLTGILTGLTVLAGFAALHGSGFGLRGIGSGGAVFFGIGIGHGRTSRGRRWLTERKTGEQTEKTCEARGPE